MKIAQKLWTSKDGWKDFPSESFQEIPQLVFIFGGRTVLEDPKHFEELRAMYKDSHLLLCSTAGEIIGTQVYDDSLAVTAVYFEKTQLQFNTTTISKPEESETKGKELASKLPHENLVHVMVFSDGLNVNGTALVKGITSNLPPTVSTTGGLVGDGAQFKQTVLGLDSQPQSNNIIIFGFYSTNLKVGYGSLGGWDSFGPERMITKATNNTLYELDHKPALVLYKDYLGDQAKDLPSSGLLFPLSLRIKNDKGQDEEIVRTLLAVNEQDQSMTFAGDMPEGVPAKLMKANFERLVDGASGAAGMSNQQLLGSKAELAILISCVGRKLVLKERTEEELEAVASEVGEQAKMTGFYSYGEICPTAATEKQCQLHNQTMTITTFTEV